MNCTSTLRHPSSAKATEGALRAESRTTQREAGKSAHITSSLQPPLKAGTYVARCCGWVDLGTQPAYAGKTVAEQSLTVVDGGLQSRNPNKPEACAKAPMQRRVMITWLIRGEAGESWRVSREFAYGFGPRCGLRKLLEGWRGKVFANDAAARAVDPLRVLEQPGLVVVGFKEGSTWPRVEAVLPMLKGVAVESLRWPPVFFTLAKPDRETFLRLPPWVRRKIRRSAEWVAMGGK